MAAWGHSLYMYYLKNGGNFRGNTGDFEGINSSLDILRDGNRILLVPQVKSGKDGKYKLEASAQVSAELPKAYTLDVSGLGFASKLSKMFAKKNPDESVTGYSKCDKKLDVVTDNKEYTKALFTSSEFRRALMNADKMTVKIVPVTGSNLHTVVVSTDIKLCGKHGVPGDVLEHMVAVASTVWHTLADTKMDVPVNPAE